MHVRIKIWWIDVPLAEVRDDGSLINDVFKPVAKFIFVAADPQISLEAMVRPHRSHMIIRYRNTAVLV